MTVERVVLPGWDETVAEMRAEIVAEWLAANGIREREAA